MAAQVPDAQYYGDGVTVDYTPTPATAAGTVITQVDLVAVANDYIAALTAGKLTTSGVFDLVKINAAIPLGTALYWDENGDPVGGTAGTGAATAVSTSNKFIGVAMEQVNDALQETVRTYCPGPTYVASSQKASLATAVSCVKDAGIAVTASGYAAITTTGGAEARSLAAPGGGVDGTIITVCHAVDGGSSKITSTQVFGDNGTDLTFTVTESAECITLIATRITATTYRWRTLYNNGVTLAAS